MKIFLPFIFLFLPGLAAISTPASAKDPFDPRQNDTTEVIKWNAEGYANRLRNSSEQTLVYAEKALALSKKLNYTNGIAESYRIKGIGKFYQNQSDSAISNYSNALAYFKKAKNQAGVAKVYNNIGGVYSAIKDYENGIENYQRSLFIAKKLGMNDLVAGVYLNLGIVFQKQGSVNKALTYYEKSNELFAQLNIPTGVAACMQDISSIYKDLHNWEKAEKYALDAIRIAKENDLSYIIASTNLTLCVVYISTHQFEKAEKAISEGLAYSKLVKDVKIDHDYLYRQFQLYTMQKNYERALASLVLVYQADSIHNENYESDKIRVLQEQNRRQDNEKENQLLKEKEKSNKILFWASILVFGLLIILIVLLIKNVSKKAQTNKKLTELNHEIFLQKENVDRVNHNLEEIIDDRTRDLKVKNKKLSEYSSHLSHQIRGPVATLKGLMNLNKEGLIDQDEVIQQMEKCVNDIDDKILRINDMLHDPLQNGFNNSSQKDSDAAFLK